MTEPEQAVRAAIEASIDEWIRSLDDFVRTPELVNAIVVALAQPDMAHQLARWLCEMDDGPFENAGGWQEGNPLFVLHQHTRSRP